MTQSQLPPERPGHPAPPEVSAARAQIAKASAAGVWETDLAPRRVMLGRCEALHFAPEDRPAVGIVLLLHGGGFRQGAPEIGGAFAAALVRRCGVSAFSLRYRLSPEFPFPAGLSDAWEAARALRGLHPGLPLLVCGDSAGGGLAAGLGILSAGAEIPVVDGLVLLSPWLDLTVSAPAYAANAASDPLFSRDAARAAAALYLQGEDPAHPLASPLHAEVERLAPTLITVGSGEVLLDDSVRFAARLRERGVAARLEVIDGMDHVAVTRGLSLPGAAECFNHVARFVDRMVAQRPAGHTP